ncbi:MAG: hypothetical protein MJH10_09950 [Epibacterium sp.]|nr:hypothetical protein [Epibacterium sp.]NQX73859.1 hypothetical protein [Epibacterium sp.]
MRVKLTSFKGIAPAISPRLINETFAQVAENVDFISGALDPIEAEGASEFTLQNSLRRTVFYYNDANWLEWAEEVDVVDGPIPNDTNKRLYWTGQDYPRVGYLAGMISGSSGYPAASYRLGVPAPSSAPGVSKSGTPNDGALVNDVAYVYTLVTAFGEEGPPSDPSAVLELQDGESVTVSLPAAHVPSGNYYFSSADGAKKRIYRSNSGSNTTAFQFVGEVTIATTSFSDTLDAAALGEVIPSTYWIGPPDDDSSTYPDGPMQGLIPVANGVFAGFSGKRLCLSEPYLPHAWPTAYRLTMEEDIVGIATSNNGVVVLTDGTPYYVTGTDPSAMTAVKVNLPQACINEHSIVDMGEYVLYAGPDGLCAVESNSGQVVTRGIITIEQWTDDFKALTYRAFLHDGTYVAFWDTGSEQGGWVYDPRSTDGAISTLTVDAVRGGYYEPETGDLYVIVDDDIVKYRGNSTKRTARWRSKEFFTPEPTGMGWIQVIADDYPVQVEVFLDGTLIADYTLTKSGSVYTQTTATPSGISAVSLTEPIMRLPNTIGNEWVVEVTTQHRVHEVTIAQNMEELRAE